MALLEFKNISKSFKMGKSELLVLDNVSGEAHEGDFIAISGPSGAGKSTLMHIIGALDAPSSGQVIFDGQDLYKMKESELNKFRGSKMGFVFQANYLLDDFTALENVMLPMIIAGGNKKAAKERAEKILADVGLSARLKHFPQELSGGEQQRVALARALINEPKIILADEPTGNLDKSNSLAVIDILSDLAAKGVCIIIVTHDESIAERALKRIKLDKK